MIARRARSTLPVLVVAEPPALYLSRPPLVVDCSVLSAVLFEEATRDEALARLAGKALHAPSLIEYEVASVALKKLAHGWPADAVHSALEGFDSHALELHRCHLPAMVDLARHLRLSAYDAAYLWLAAQLKAPLATFDAQLGKAAQRHLGALE